MHKNETEVETEETYLCIYIYTYRNDCCFLTGRNAQQKKTQQEDTGMVITQNVLEIGMEPTKNDNLSVYFDGTYPLAIKGGVLENPQFQLDIFFTSYKQRRFKFAKFDDL